MTHAAQYFHCNTIYNSQDMEKPKCPLTDDWIKKMWYQVQAGRARAPSEEAGVPEGLLVLLLPLNLADEKVMPMALSSSTTML